MADKPHMLSKVGESPTSAVVIQTKQQKFSVNRDCYWNAAEEVATLIRLGWGKMKRSLRERDGRLARQYTSCHPCAHSRELVRSAWEQFGHFTKIAIPVQANGQTWHLPSSSDIP
jgi:hypothetical protein